MEHEAFEHIIRDTIGQLPEWVREALHNVEFLVLAARQGSKGQPGNVELAVGSQAKARVQAVVLPPDGNREQHVRVAGLRRPFFEKKALAFVVSGFGDTFHHARVAETAPVSQTLGKIVTENDRARRDGIPLVLPRGNLPGVDVSGLGE